MPSTIRRIPEALFEPVMDAARAAFPAGNPCGVFAMEIGRPSVGGRERPYPALVVHVRRKVADPPSPVPTLWVEHEGREYEVVPDVQATGAEPVPQSAPRPEFSGVHISAAILSARYGVFRSYGGVSAILADEAGDPRWLVTAGHLFDSNGKQPGWNLWAAREGTVPKVRVGRLHVNLLDEDEPDQRFDTALVELTPEGKLLLGDVGIHAFAAPQHGQPAQPYLSTSNTWGKVGTVHRYPNTIHFHGETRPAWTVHNVVKSDRVLTNAGDSGCALCDTRSAPYAVLASTVGVLGTSTVFEPIVRSLLAFRRQLGINLQPWKP